MDKLYIPIEKKSLAVGDFDREHNIRLLNITKWVMDKKEDHLIKLVNVYQVISREECNISLIFRRTMTTCEVYLAVTNNRNADNNVEIESFKNRIEGALKGNFPGAEWKSKKGCNIPSFLDSEIPYSVATTSNIPDIKSEKFISQTIDKLLDGIIPKNQNEDYVIILMATPVLDIDERKLHLSKLYSGLHPYSNWSTNYTFTTQNSIGSSATFGINVGASAGIQAGLNGSVGSSTGTTDNTSTASTHSSNDSSSYSSTESTNDTRGESFSTNESHSDGKSSSVGSSITVGVNTGPIESEVSGNVNVGNSSSDTISHGSSQTNSTSIGKSIGKSLARNIDQSVAKSLGKALTSSTSHSKGVFGGINTGINFGANFARSSTTTVSIGKNEGINQNFINHSIKHALENLDVQMKRLEESSALGTWDFAAYFLSEDLNMANNVAQSYIALTQGEKSYL